MYKYKNSCKKGFTLIEIIVTIPIIIIVMTLTFSIYDFGIKTYKNSVIKSENQQDVRLVADYIMKNVRNARRVSTNEIDVQTIDGKATGQPEDEYYSLGFDNIDRQLVLSTYTRNIVPVTVPPTPPSWNLTSKIIGAKIARLAFIPCDDRGMVQFNVQDSAKGINYSHDFEFMLENLSSINNSSLDLKRFITKSIIPAKPATSTTPLIPEVPAGVESPIIYYSKYK